MRMVCAYVVCVCGIHCMRGELNRESGCGCGFAPRGRLSRFGMGSSELVLTRQSALCVVGLASPALSLTRCRRMRWSPRRARLSLLRWPGRAMRWREANLPTPLCCREACSSPLVFQVMLLLLENILRQL